MIFENTRILKNTKMRKERKVNIKVMQETRRNMTARRIMVPENGVKGVTMTLTPRGVKNVCSNILILSTYLYYILQTTEVNSTYVLLGVELTITST